MKIKEGKIIKIVITLIEKKKQNKDAENKLKIVI